MDFDLNDSLYVELAAVDPGLMISDPVSPLITFKLNVIYAGKFPPKTILLGDYSEAPILEGLFNVTAVLGPWIKINEGLWGLEKIENESKDAMLPPVKFNISDINKWPNENMTARIYVAHSYTQINGDNNVNNKLYFSTLNPQVQDVFYIVVGSTREKTWELQPYGMDLFEVSSHLLTTNHNGTNLMAFKLFPFMMDVYILLLSIIILYVPFYLLNQKYEWVDFNIGYDELITMEISLLGFFIATYLNIKNYIPYWGASLFIKINSIIIYYFSIVLITWILKIIKHNAKESAEF